MFRSCNLNNYINILSLSHFEKRSSIILLIKLALWLYKTFGGKYFVIQLSILVIS